VIFFGKRTIDVPEHLRKAELKDMKVIATIGVGGFGRVELVGVVHINFNKYMMWLIGSRGFLTWMGYILHFKMLSLFTLVTVKRQVQLLSNRLFQTCMSGY